MPACPDADVDATMRDDVRVSSRDVLERVARRTHRFDFAVWFWGDAIAFDGLLDAAELLQDDSHARFCIGFYERWQRAGSAWTDYLTPGLSLIRLVRRHGAAPLEPLVRRLLDHYLLTTPRGTTGLHYFRPDLPQFRTTLLIDSLYHVPPFVAACGDLLGEEALCYEAMSMWNDHAATLGLPGKALLFHNYEHGTGRRRGYGWGRGNGWAMFGLLDLIEILGDRHAARTAAIERFRELAAAIAALQDRSGFWRTLLEDRESYLETSTAGFFGAIFTKAVRLGLLPMEYSASAERAWRALLSRIDGEGGAFGTSAATWAANAPAEDLNLYRAAPTEINVWGQGAALRFAAERVRAGLP
jgi:unsaturated rhamnogalacturonyl hydrolase